jgi:hypothetical protein
VIVKCPIITFSLANTPTGIDDRASISNTSDIGKIQIGNPL